MKSLTLQKRIRLMDKVNIKNEINKYLDQADGRLLQLIYGMIQADKKSVVGYHPEGKPITKEELIARAERSEQDIKAGRLKTSAQIRAAMKNW